jgi:hypothetical protein
MDGWRQFRQTTCATRGENGGLSKRGRGADCRVRVIGRKGSIGMGRPEGLPGAGGGWVRLRLTLSPIEIEIEIFMDFLSRYCT